MYVFSPDMCKSSQLNGARLTGDINNDMNHRCYRITPKGDITKLIIKLPGSCRAHNLSDALLVEGISTSSTTPKCTDWEGLFDGVE